MKAEFCWNNDAETVKKVFFLQKNVLFFRISLDKYGENRILYNERNRNREKETISIFGNDKISGVI